MKIQAVVMSGHGAPHLVHLAVPSEGEEVRRVRRPAARRVCPWTAFLTLAWSSDSQTRLAPPHVLSVWEVCC